MNLSIVIFILALLVYISLEFLRKKYKIDELNKKSKELLEKFKQDTNNEKILVELVDIQKKVFNYFITTTLLILFVIISIKIFLSEIPFRTEVTNTSLIFHVNPIYSENLAALYINKTFLGLFEITNGQIIINDKEKINLIENSRGIKLSLVFIKLPFKLPIINKNWLGPIGSYIVFYFLISFLLGTIKKIYKYFVQKRANG